MRFLFFVLTIIFTGPSFADGPDVLFLGEIHDNPAHHFGQAEEIRRFAPRAVVFEMLTGDQAARITPELLDDPDELAAVLEWSTSGWPDFDIYAPVFEESRGARIYGAFLPRALFTSAMRDGAAAVFPGNPDRFGLDQSLPEDQQAIRNALQDDAHCGAMPVQMLPRMVEVQRLRDAELARVALLALEETGGPVAVILGNGHARTDWGAPALMAVAAPDVDSHSLAFLEAEPEAGAPYDAWLITDPTPRGDPCAAFN